MGTFLVALFFIPNFRWFEHNGNNSFTIFLYGEQIGVVSSEKHADKLLMKARKALAARSNSLVMLEPMDYTVNGEEAVFRKNDTDKEIIRNMTEVMQTHTKKARRTAYTMKVRGITVNMANADEIKELLQRAIEKYDPDNTYEVVMEKDADRDLNVLTASIRKKSPEEADEPAIGGAEMILSEADKACAEAYDLSFDDYTLGLQSMGLSQTIEVVEASVSADELMSTEEAFALLTEEQATMQTYEVQSGDTLSAISLKLNIPMETIVAMNSEYMDSVNSTIHIGQTLVITVPRWNV